MTFPFCYILFLVDIPCYFLFRIKDRICSYIHIPFFSIPTNKSPFYIYLAPQPHCNFARTIFAYGVSVFKSLVTLLIYEMRGGIIINIGEIWIYELNRSE